MPHSGSLSDLVWKNYHQYEQSKEDWKRMCFKKKTMEKHIYNILKPQYNEHGEAKSTRGKVFFFSVFSPRRFSLFLMHGTAASKRL